MKKIIALFVASVCLAAATFALDFEVGAKVNLGQDLGKQSIKEAVQAINIDSEFQFGGSAYVHASLFPFLGVQIEPTVFSSKVKLEGQGVNQTETFKTLTLDIPVMYWSSLKIWKLGVGVGVGVNFSTTLNRDVVTIAKELINDPKSFAWGFVAGADAKLYLTNHLGIVGSVRYVMDLSKKEVPITIDVAGMTLPTGQTYPTMEVGRKFLYGTLGLEFKLF